MTLSLGSIVTYLNATLVRRLPWQVREDYAHNDHHSICMGRPGHWRRFLRRFALAREKVTQVTEKVLELIVPGRYLLVE